MIGNPTRCCSIDYTGKTTLTSTLSHPSLLDIGIYLAACLVIIFFIYQQIEDRKARRKQRNNMRINYDTD